MADWDEIKRLAADFQRTQTSDTLQRISERNCIDIIKKITDLNLIELIYTCDGKEFLTPDHLLKEIEDEIYVNGGRMHLHDLATNLNVDYQHVENKAKDLARDKSSEYSLILGQVIHSTYKKTLGKQIYDCMIINGQLSIAEFAKSLDLPSEFLLTIVKELLPRVMDDFVVSQDGRTYYTTDMMDRYKSIIAGTLSAISKPTTIASIMKRLDIPERIFTPTVDSLIKEGRIDATVENRLFIPAIYAREQSEWIDKFYSSNSYIEYDVLSRMDIKQPKAFLKKRFPDGIQLKTCFISPILVSQVESLVEDCIASNSWIDIGTIVPSAIETQDIEQLLQDIFKQNKQFSSSCLIFNETNVCSVGFVATCKDSLTKLMQAKAQDHLKQGKLVAHFMGGKLKEPPREEAKKLDPSPGIRPGVDVKPGTESKLDADEKSGTESKPGSESKSAEPKPDTESKSGVEGKSGADLKQSGDAKSATESKTISKAKSRAEARSKAPRSRAARRAMSPERPTLARKEPLVFMNTEELIQKLRIETRSSYECSEEFLESIAKILENELNTTYETLAKQTLDDYLKSQADDENADPSNADDVELIE